MKSINKKNKRIGGKWSLKYKKSINCNRPKGFSQRQHCKYGRTKKNKKQFGGNGSGYTLVGFTNGNVAHNHFIVKSDEERKQFAGTMFGCQPVYLPNHEIKGSLYSRLGGRMFIILPELYKVEWVHGKLDLISMLNHQIHFCDKNEKFYFNKLPPLIPARVGGEFPRNDPVELNRWLNEVQWSPQQLIQNGLDNNPTRKDIIIEIETKYPGLFKPMFVNDPTRYHYAYDDTYVNAI